MSNNASTRVRKPQHDGRLLWDIILGVYGYQAVLLAHELGLFPFLAGGPRSIEEIAAALNIACRPARAILQACLALELVREEEGRYLLTPVAEEYLLEESPVYFGGFFDYTLAHCQVLSFDSLKKAVLTNTSQVYGGEEIYKSHAEQVERAHAFTRMMHSHSMAPALVWPEKIDLSGQLTMLDVGGGSGAHSICAALRWPELRAVILDLPYVCEAAQEYLARHGVQDRIRTHAADMWHDPFPPADIHFYSEIFHDFTPEQCRFLTAKSFAGLARGGRIIVHEMLYNSGKPGPFTVAGFDVSMLLWTEGQQFSGSELSAMLAEAGFVDVAVVATLGYWGIVTGRKP
jgi:O-methyltransferase/methyltransferase family protein